METKQPVWELITNLGDVHPLDYGGYFIYRDTTGLYPEEGEKLFADESADRWEIYRFPLDRCKMVGGFLIPFRWDSSWPYPANHYVEWFNQGLCDVASYVGESLEELQSELCSKNPLDRARAYESIGNYHGFDNLDSCPLFFNDRAEVEKRYAISAR